MTTSTLVAGLNEEQLLAVLTALKNGDFTQRMPQGGSGTAGLIHETLNAILEQCQDFASETNRITREIGMEGRFGGQAVVPDASGSWKEMTDSLNGMARNLTDQVRDLALTTHAIAGGDLARKMEVEAKGEILELKTTINIMVEQLNSFASEVTHLMRDLGTEGKLGGQARVKGAIGTWQDLLDNINFMANNLTVQIRSIADVAASIAEGDFSRRLSVTARGEVGALKQTLNDVVGHFHTLDYEFNRIAREIGVEGKFGGQAEVPGLEGRWRELISNFNRMSANLTVQVRDLSRTAQALVSGDTSRKVTAIAAGETVELKDAVNSLVDQHNRSRR